MHGVRGSQRSHRAHFKATEVTWVTETPQCVSDMVAKFSELRGKRDVDIAYFGQILVLWALDAMKTCSS